MKVIGTDNFDRETKSDTLIAENLSDWMANFIVNALNKAYCNSDHSETYYKAVPDDHKLYKFEP